MPCACNIPLENAPDNEVWGPILWNLLHGIAEHVGKGGNQTEESYSLIQLLKLTEKIIPCPTCKEHYKTWLTYHPPDMLKKCLMKIIVNGLVIFSGLFITKLIEIIRKRFSHLLL